MTAGCSLLSHKVRCVAVTLLLVYAPLPPRASAQAHRTVEIVVGDRVQVSADRSTFPHVEAHVAVSASPPTYMVGAAMVFEPGDYVPRLAAYTSHDSGRTWTRAELPRPEGDARTTGTGFFDPWATITNEGIAYVSGLMLTSQGGEIYVWRSDDRGLRWKPPSRVPRGDGGSFDHPVTSVGPGGLVYVFANQGAGGGARGTSGTSLSRSTDGGATFGSPVTILPNNFSNINGNLATLSDGSLIVTWFEISKPGIPRIVHRRLWTSLSTDGGRTFLPPRLVVEGYAARWPILAVDRSDSTRGDRVYAAWVGMEDSSGATDDRAFIAWSDDRGVNWSRPRPVDVRSRARRFNLMMAVSPEGVVGMSWYDWDVNCTRLVFAASVDHGQSFSDPQPVSPRWCPDSSQTSNRVALPGGQTVAERWPTGGDYHGLVAGPGPQFSAFWVDGSTGVFQVFTAPIRIAGRQQR